MVKFIFLFSLALVFYTYFGYWMLLYLIGLFFKRSVSKNDFYPKVSFIIAAYNEEVTIRAKLDNTLRSDYPKDKLEIIVVSDCSTDNTDTIVKEFSNQGVMLLRQQVRNGKTEAQNEAAKNATGEILLFSDATTNYKEDTIKKIVRSFHDSIVGCVEGKLIFTNNGDNDLAVERGFFTKIETLIRIKESQIGSVLGVSGCVYAVRKNLYRTMDKALVSDLGISFIIVNQGYRVVFERDAIVTEKSGLSIREEFKRNTRTVCQGWVAIMILRKQIFEMFNLPHLRFFLVQLFSHKILRWITPFLLLNIYFTNLFITLSSGFGVYSIFFIAQSLCYLAVILNILLKFKPLNRSKFMQIATFFCMYNAAAIIGLYKFLRGDKKAFWQTTR